MRAGDHEGSRAATLRVIFSIVGPVDVSPTWKEIDVGRSRTRILAVFMIVIGLFAALTVGAGAIPTKPSPPRGDVNGQLTIGQLAPLTGALSSIASSLTTPVMMAINEINAGGGALGQPVTYTLRDDGTEPGVAIVTAKDLLGPNKVDAIIGPTSSGTTLGIIDDLRDARVLVCSGTNTNVDLSTTDSGGYYFRTAPSDRLQMPALARLVLKDGHKKIGILVRGDPENRGTLQKPLKTTLTKGGAKIVADVAFDPDATSFDAYVDRVAAKKPDAVVVLGDESDNDVIKTMIDKGLGPQQIPIYLPDAMRTNTFASEVDPNNPGVVAGIKGTSPAAAPAGVQNSFPDTFKATGVEPIFSAYNYDCTILTALAAEKAKSDDPAKMKQVFAANIWGKHKCNTYAGCKKLLDEGKTIQYQGASAVFAHMNKFGTFEPNAGVYEIWSFDNAGRDIVQPTDPQIRVG